MSTKNVVMIIIVIKLFGGSRANEAMINDSFFDLTTPDMKNNHQGRDRYEQTDGVKDPNDIDPDFFGIYRQEDENGSWDAGFANQNGSDIEQQLDDFFHEDAKWAIIYSDLEKGAGNTANNHTIVFGKRSLAGTLENHFRVVNLTTISSMPVKFVKIRDEELQERKNECVVCLEKFKNSDVSHSQPCQNTLREKCIDRWLVDWQNCSFCKADILTNDEESDTNFVVA